MKAARSIALILLGILLLAGCRSESQPAGPDPNAIVAIGITPTSAVLAPSDTQRFTVVAIRANGDSVAATGVSFEATGGTVDVAGLYRAGPVGDYDVRARRGSGPSEVGAVARVSVRAAPPPPPPPPPSANYPNRPANFTQIVTDYAMNTAVPGTSGDRSLGDGSGWSATGDPQRVSDPTDPVSPPWVMEWTYPAGQGTPTESYTAGKLYHALPTDATEFYFAFPVWHDPNFEWNAISNKMLFVQKNGFGLLLESKHNAEYWVVQAGGYPGPGLTTVYSPNVWAGPDPTGRWVKVELLVKFGPGGHFKLFLDGALAANHTGTNFPTGLEEVLVDGTWGGGSGPSQRTSYRRIGHVLIATPDAPPAPSGPLGINADLHPRQLFPASNPWNQPVDTAQVDPNSAAIITTIGSGKALHPDFGANGNGGPFGIAYVVVSGTQARVPVTFDYDDESDPGPYPIPANAPIEGGAGSSEDRHVLIVDRDAWKLYELFAAYPQANGSWQAGSGAVFDLSSNALRPAGWTSADAAGLPILAGLVRYDEVVAGEITHVLRFTVSVTRNAYIPPARHWASSNTSSLRPPMGMRVRLKESFNIATYPARVQVILRALKKYGMIVADNGSDWFLSGVADARWNDGEINTLKQLRGSDFEVVRMTGVVTP